MDANSTALPATQAPAFSGNSSEVQKNREQINRITYLASLASRLKDVDARLDALREVTSSWDQTVPLGQTQTSKLSTLEADLKQYLLHDDPLRSFTAESLEERLKKNAGGASFIEANKKNFLLVIGLSFAASAGSLLPFFGNLPVPSRITLAGGLFMTVLHLGVAWFYISSLKGFNREVKRAFIFFCLGILVLIPGFGQHVFISIWHLDAYDAFRFSGLTWLFAIPFVLMVVGWRITERLLGGKSRINSIPIMLAAFGVVVAIDVILPHKPGGSEIFYDIGTGSALVISVASIYNAIFVHRIRKLATDTYRKPMTILFWYYSVVWVSGVGGAAAIYALGELRGVYMALIWSVFAIPQQTVLLYAGYLFKRETSK